MADLINFFFPNFTFVYELTMDVIDVFYKFSKIIIALINVYLLYYIFNYNTKANASQNEKDRKTRLFTKIIIEHNFERVSSFYSGLFTIFNVFGEESIDINTRKNVEAQLQVHFSDFRKGFIDLLMAVDGRLHKDFQDEFDKLLGSLVTSIFDEGINLSHGPKYDEIIRKEISRTKVTHIKLLFNYQG